MNKSTKGIYEHTQERSEHKKFKLRKQKQNLNKENPNRENMEMNSLGTLTGNKEVSLTNRIYKTTLIFSCIEDKVEEMHT